MQAESAKTGGPGYIFITENLLLFYRRLNCNYKTAVVGVARASVRRVDGAADTALRSQLRPILN